MVALDFEGVPGVHVLSDTELEELLSAVLAEQSRRRPALPAQTVEPAAEPATPAEEARVALTSRYGRV